MKLVGCQNVSLNKYMTQVQNLRMNRRLHIAIQQYNKAWETPTSASSCYYKNHIRSSKYFFFLFVSVKILTLLHLTENDKAAGVVAVSASETTCIPHHAA